MQCIKCGAEYPSDQLRCPYCNSVNEHALKLAKELQQYDKAYEESREEMLNTGEITVLRKITFGIGIAFLVILVLFGSYIKYYKYNYESNSPSNVTGAKYKKNKAKLEEYMNNKDYVRAFYLASNTDPTTEYFKNYPEYKDELSAIYQYTLIMHDIMTTTEDMDNGDNYRSLSQTMVILLNIFYNEEDTPVKAELEVELEQYLRNLYRLTDAEIEQLKNIENAEDFTLDGDSDYEKISKERMVEYYGK